MGSYESYNEAISDILKKIAMHVSASKPQALDEEQLDKKLLIKKENFLEQLADSGKPKDILNKMLMVKLRNLYLK